MDALEPISLANAASRFDRPYVTVRVWAHRYHAAKIGNIGRHARYDYGDLALIEWFIRTGRPVPNSPAARAQAHADHPART